MSLIRISWGASRVDNWGKRSGSSGSSPNSADLELRDRVAVVTAGTRGLGHRVAMGLHREPTPSRAASAHLRSPATPMTLEASGRRRLRRLTATADRVQDASPDQAATGTDQEPVGSE